MELQSERFNEYTCDNFTINKNFCQINFFEYRMYYFQHCCQVDFRKAFKIAYVVNIVRKKLNRSFGSNYKDMLDIIAKFVIISAFELLIK